MKIVLFCVCFLSLLAVTVPAQVTDAGEPTLTPEQARDLKAAEAARIRREDLREAARIRQLTGAPPAEATKFPTRFGFGGGSLWEFIESIKEQFGVDLRQVGTVPDGMEHGVQVPKMRFGDGNSGLTYVSVLNLYNQVSEESKSGMGRWIIKGAPTNPDVLLLTPSSSSDSTQFSVKAFAFPGHGRGAQKLSQLRNMVSAQKNELLISISQQRQAGLARADVEGELDYHRDAGIIVVRGGKVYVEMASAIIQALKEKPDMSEIPIPPRQKSSE